MAAAVAQVLPQASFGVPVLDADVLVRMATTAAAAPALTQLVDGVPVPAPGTLGSSVLAVGPVTVGAAPGPAVVAAPAVLPAGVAANGAPLAGVG